MQLRLAGTLSPGCPPAFPEAAKTDGPETPGLVLIVGAPIAPCVVALRGIDRLSGCAGGRGPVPWLPGPLR